MNGAVVVASSRRPNDGSVWRCSRWSYLVCGVTYLCAPATVAGSGVAVAASLTKLRRLDTGFFIGW